MLSTLILGNLLINIFFTDAKEGRLCFKSLQDALKNPRGGREDGGGELRHEINNIFKIMVALKDPLSGPKFYNFQKLFEF